MGEAVDIIQRIREKAKRANKKVVLPESFEERTIRAAEIASKEGIARIVLIGEESALKERAKELKVSLDGIEIINPDTYPEKELLASTLVELRKNKGIDTLDKAYEVLKNPLYFSTMLLKLDRVDGWVAGAAHSSADAERPIFQIIKTAPGIDIASGAFLMVVPDCPYGENGIFLYADCGVNPNPNANELASIAISSAQLFRLLVEKEPRVAMLSFSTKGSAKHELVDKVVEATKIAKSKAPDLVIDGELQGDAALVPTIGNSKAPGSPVAGKANVLIFPDLNAGNICYKLTERLAKAKAIGPILQGTAKPANDLSRGCSVEDIVDSIAIVCVRATSL
ncbi:MAG: phosphate acetyltransferase [bacterium]|nr:phosphate acetyltransferase [bacterium]